MADIEIYTKIMDAIKGEEPAAASTALEFAMRKNQNELYKLQTAKNNYIGFGSAAQVCTQEYAAKERAHAEQIVRNIAREEMKNPIDVNEAA